MKTYGPYRGIVDRVIDGDTVHVAIDLGFDLTVHARIRVYGINAPELATVAGKEAKQFAETLLHVGDTVSVVSHNWDKYGGRIDADLLVGSLNFGAAMVKAGHAAAWDGKGTKP